AHAQPMELGPVEELREYPRNLLADDAGAVVGDRNPEAARLAGRRRSFAIRDDLQLDDHFREDSGFLTCIKRIIDGLLDAREQRLSRVVETQEMPVLGEELGNGDLPLASPHLDCRDGRLRSGSTGTGLLGFGLPAVSRHVFFRVRSYKV